MQLIKHEEGNTVDEKCTEGLNIFLFYFLIEMLEYCLYGVILSCHACHIAFYFAVIKP